MEKNLNELRLFTQFNKPVVSAKPRRVDIYHSKDMIERNRERSMELLKQHLKENQKRYEHILQ